MCERDCAVIRICNEDFSAGTHDGTGLHGRTERGARGVTIYLLPGLTTGERRAALRRLRQEASRGLGPPLPRSQLAVALGLDRVRTAARIAKAIVRLHPAVTLLPGVLVVALLALFVAASAEGARDLVKTQVGLADSVPARSGTDPQTGIVLPQLARITEITVVVGVHARTNGEGMLSGLVPRQRAGQPERAGQPAFRPAALGAAPPFITQLPGPRDLAG